MCMTSFIHLSPPKTLDDKMIHSASVLSDWLHLFHSEINVVNTLESNVRSLSLWSKAEPLLAYMNAAQQVLSSAAL